MIRVEGCQETLEGGHRGPFGSLSSIVPSVYSVAVRNPCPSFFWETLTVADDVANMYR